MKWLMTICLICLTVQIAGAAVIFDNGAPDQQNGNEATLWIQSEDFMVKQPEILTDCHFWTLEGYGAPYGGNPWDGTLQYWVFADNGGTPGAIIDSGSGQNIVKTGTGGTANGANEFVYDFDLQQPVPLAADSIYWLGLHLASDYQDGDQIFWETTSQGWGSTGIESSGGTMDNWANNGQHHAFYLTTPEPTTICLLGLGALSLIRKKRA